MFSSMFTKLYLLNTPSSTGTTTNTNTTTTTTSGSGTSTTTGLSNSIYAPQDNNLTDAGEKIIAQIGSIGGISFTAAVMIIALVIIFGSISPKNIGRWWMALFSCVGGAILFFGAYLFADFVAGIF